MRNKMNNFGLPKAEYDLAPKAIQRDSSRGKPTWPLTTRLHRGATTTRNRRNLIAFLKGRCLFNSFVPFSNILASYGSAGSLLTGFECHSFRICLAHRRVSRGRGRDTCVCSGSHDEQGERSTCADDPCHSTWFILCAFERSSLLVGVVHSRRSHNHI